MGVRDYDPAINRFLTPDPLLLEDVPACASAAISCNLYSYAGNNPTTYVDSTGQFQSLGHAVLPYHLFQLAGLPAQTAAKLGFLIDKPDHLESQRPVSVPNIVSGITGEIHFNKAVPVLMWLFLDRGVRNDEQFGLFAHGLTDMGWEDTCGP